MRLRPGVVVLVVVALAGQGLAAVARPAAPSNRAVSVERATDIAAHYVHEHPARFGVSPSDVSSLLVTDAYRSDHNGLTHVYLRQVVSGIEVLGANMTVAVDRDGGIFHVGSRFLPNVQTRASGQRILNAAAALGAAMTALDVSRADATVSTSPQLVYQPTDGGALRLAWNVEIAQTS